MPLRPTAERVAVAWLKALSGIPDNAVATVLPGPDDAGNYSWAASGFVQVVGVVGGDPGLDVPIRRSVLEISCWAVNVNRKQPPWGRANALAEELVYAVYGYLDSTDPRGPVVLPDSYGGAMVHTAIVQSEPRRRPADPSNYARYGLELELVWSAL